MTLIGTPPIEWVDLIDTLVPDILDLVFSSWESMPSPDSDALEDPMTEALCRCLRQNRSSNALPFRIDIQAVELDPSIDKDQGRMDITFSPMVPDESIYFCLECKRLNVVNDGRVRSYAVEYVVNGMMRFIQGKYSSQVRHGGMLAYILNKNIRSAINSVSGAIQSRYIELGMSPPGEMRSSSLRPYNSQIQETHHVRAYNSRSFQIHHIFAA
jgi:hypothetical protein